MSVNSFSKLSVFFVALTFTVAIFVGPLAQAYSPEDRVVKAHETPAELEGVGITDHTGRQLDLSIPFIADNGKNVVLGEYFNGTQPVLMTMVYYNCPSLCNFHLNGLLDVFKKMRLVAGKDFKVVAVSMNHRETPALAQAKKESYLKEYGRSGTAEGWHFLTGTEENVKKLADQLGFGFKWVESQQEYAHASAAFVATPSGQLSRYLYGIEFPPKTLRLSLLEASGGKIGSVVDQLILYCFRFDPNKNKYTVYALSIMRVAGLVTVLILAIILVPVYFREKYNNSAENS